MAEENPFTAAWSRGGNLLCHGHWIIHWQNQLLILPESRREKDMGTGESIRLLILRMRPLHKAYRKMSGS